MLKISVLGEEKSPKLEGFVEQVSLSRQWNSERVMNDNSEELTEQDNAIDAGREESQLRDWDEVDRAKH